MRVQSKRAGEQVEVMGSGPIPDVKLGPVSVYGETPGAGEFDASIPREAADLQNVVPVIADATERSRARDEALEATIPRPRIFRVTNPGGRHVNTGDSGRVHLHEGKELSTSHYNIRALEKQGLNLVEVKDDARDPHAVSVLDS
jgi:hypothetical protein